MEEIPIVLIGHKDHGKSTLIGRLLLDTKSIRENKIKEIKETMGKKFELAHLIDSFKEERERKMTIDTTQVILKGKKRIYRLIDVPGHENLISQMLTGASAAKVSLLLVDVTEGIKEQTIQHLKIAKLLGIEKLGVVINKMDKVGYRKEPFQKLVERLKKIIRKIGYFSKKVYFFPVSALKGENVLKKSSKMPWYSGISLIKFLETKIKKIESFENLPLRFLVQDEFEGYLIGKIEAGKLKKGQEILFLPENKKAKIKSIRNSEREIEKAKAGQNVGILLGKKIDISRGSVGSSLKFPPKVENVLSGEIFWIEAPSQKKLILECGTSQAEGKLLEPKSVRAKEKSFYKIFLENKIAFDPESKTILGKIVLKERGKIIGIGNIK